MNTKTEGGYLIAQIHQLSGRIFSKMLHDYRIDLNHAQGRIMFALWKNDGIPINDLAKETSLSKSTLTTMLERLEKSGHILRKPSEQDRRVTLVYLTRKSTAMRSDYLSVSNKMTHAFYEGFAPEDILRFEDHLKTILANLKGLLP